MPSAKHNLTMERGMGLIPSLLNVAILSYTDWAHGGANGNRSDSILCLRIQLKSLYKMWTVNYIADTFHWIDGNWGATDLHLFLDLDITIPSAGSQLEYKFSPAAHLNSKLIFNRHTT